MLASCVAAAFRDRDEPLNIGADGDVGVLQRIPHPALHGQVDHAMKALALEELLHSRPASHIHAKEAKLRVRFEQRQAAVHQPRLVFVVEVVNVHDRVAVIQQPLRDVEADESSRASYEDWVRHNQFVSSVAAALRAGRLAAGWPFDGRPLRANEVPRCLAEDTAGVHHQGRLARDELVVHVGMVGDKEDGVLGGEGLGVQGDGAKAAIVGVAAGEADLGDVRVVVSDFGAEVVEKVHDFEGGAFAGVVNVLLVGDSEEEDFGTFDGFAASVEGEGELLDDVLGHLHVDLAGELDELGGATELLGLPGEVEGVDGDAVATPSRAGIEAHEAEGLGGGGVEDLPDVDAHSVEDDLELVDQGDVDGAEDVLQELGALCHFETADRDNVVHRRSVEGHGQPQGGIVIAAHDLRDVLRVVFGVTRVLALWGEGEEEVVAGLQRPGFEPGE
jgi:hypothetical protein